MRGSFKELSRRLWLKSHEDGVAPISQPVARLLYALAYSLAKARGRISILEIGTGYGFSTLWLAKAVADSGAEGEVLSIDSMVERIEVARKYAEEAGLAARVKFLVGDAKEVARSLDVELDIVFIDGRKEETPPT